ncbi:hypothetical protein D0861_05549 [Hortaea werneckii]|uniref:Ubiquitin-conjugating enzyme E2 2 n=1 Tax=Hortaea werneckii TaxID=91943 RepID=A0A3M7FFQ6_HORWE|nr:hypothetical protein D0861_05549 [Hortaea werneckii]
MASPLGRATSSPGGSSSAAILLGKQFKQMQTDTDIRGISVGLVGDSIFDWEILLMIDEEQDNLYGERLCGTSGAKDDALDRKTRSTPQPQGRGSGDGMEVSWTNARMANTLISGGCFRARIAFPNTYPLYPPKMTFLTPMFHPNVYLSGEVCISILHPPEDDKYGYESAAERWSPVQTPETILLSVISMLSSPNDESPANIEAGKLWRNDKKEFRKRVRKCVRDSQESAWD